MTIAVAGMICLGAPALMAKGPAAAPTAQARSACDAELATRFETAGRRVLLVRPFKKGDTIPARSLAGMVPNPPPSTALADLCLVKVLVGPGNPGPAGAPSTSAGIGIEIWLPEPVVWNGRLHAIGNGGWTGSEESDPTRVSSYPSSFDGRSAAQIAAEEGAVSATSDGGHTVDVSKGAIPSIDGSFAMKPDGSINTALWKDFAARAVHEQAVVAKALATLYYGRAPRYSYFEGGSNGGRQALAAAQRYPADFDGIISGFPALGWTKFITAGLYPQIVIQVDLAGKAFTPAQLDFVSNKAIAACDIVGGKHLGYILDAESCRYDPTIDPEVLCASNGGGNSTPDCLTPAEARAINKIWYGMTVDGTVPDPKVDNGTGPLTATHLGHGLARGSSLLAVATAVAFPISTDMVGLELQDASFASPMLRNPSKTARDGWKTLGYSGLVRAFRAGLALQPQFASINSDDSDLRAFQARGGKLLHLHGTADALIPYEGSVAYYRSVIERMGGLAPTQSFYRFYIVAGMGHGTHNGTANAMANPPIPTPLGAEMYEALTAWVEKGLAPDGLRLSAQAPAGASSLPLCPFPSRPVHVDGDPAKAESYSCR